MRQEEEKAARIAAEEAELQKKKEEEEAKKNALAAMSMNFSGYQAAREKQRKGKVKLWSITISFFKRSLVREHFSEQLYKAHRISCQ